MRIQKSVFEVQGNKKEIEELIQDVEKMVNPDTDKIAVIPLCDTDYANVCFLGILSRRPGMLPSYYVL